MPAGFFQFVYNGAPAFVEDALASFAGKYAWAEFTPPGADRTLQYVPGRSTNRPIITPRSTVTLFLTEPVTLPSPASNGAAGR